MPHFLWWQWALGALSAFLVGVSKTGMPGIGILVVPIMVLLVGDARLAAGWSLPMLCTADLFAIYYWRRHAAARRLLDLAPWTLAGMGLGAIALGWSDRTLRPIVGVIVLAMLAIHVWRKLRPELLEAPAHAAPYGVTAGFATTIANAAGPVMSLYLLGKRLPKEEFVATGAWFFFVLNLSKVPIYLWRGLFTPTSLRFDALAIPAVLCGALAGKWITLHLPTHLFETAVLVLAAGATLLLFL